MLTFASAVIITELPSQILQQYWYISILGEMVNDLCHLCYAHIYNGRHNYRTPLPNFTTVLVYRYPREMVNVLSY